MTDNSKNAYEQKMIAECINCGVCVDECEFLSETGETPSDRASRGISLQEAFSCSLCGKCTQVCPLNLRPVDMFQARREQALKDREVDPADYRYLLPDEDENVMKLVRQYYDIHYDDVDNDQESETVFFPGCTLLTYAPDLTRKVLERMRSQTDCEGIINGCCGKPLQQMGLTERAEAMKSGLLAELKQRKTRRVIFGCPNCFYFLRGFLNSNGINAVTVYEVIDVADSQPQGKTCIIHDSCPDREQGIFARQVREKIKQKGYLLKEMTNNQAISPCCGSGGQLSHFRPDLAETSVDRRLSEGEATKADILATYCLSCALNLARKPSGLKVRHALNLLLDFDEDYSDVKARVAKLFTNND